MSNGVGADSAVDTEAQERQSLTWKNFHHSVFFYICIQTKHGISQSLAKYCKGVDV